MPIISAQNLHRTYRLGRVSVPVLRGVDLSVDEGEWVCVLGASGSGKSTLLHLLGALDRPDRTPKATVQFRDHDVFAKSSREQDRYRTRSVGFVFQFYHLLPELTVLENTALGAMVRYGRFGYLRRKGDIRARAEALLDSFSMQPRLRHRPSELSGGERQRVAIARALMNEPDILLADEPTGNLDSETGGRILDVIGNLHTKGQTIVMVTHDQRIAERADRIVRLESGQLVS